MIAELRSLNARVAQLEGFTDMFKKAKDTMHSVQHAIQGEVTQAAVMDTLRVYDKTVRAQDESHFKFKVGAQEAMLEWIEGPPPRFKLMIGDHAYELDSLKAVRDVLDLHKKTKMMATANLSRYAAAVLQQQARMAGGAPPLAV